MRIMTVREVAALLRIKEKTVCALASQGKLPGFKLGKCWRFEKDAVARLFAPTPRSHEMRPAG